MKLIDVDIAAEESFAPCSGEWPIEGGTTYAVCFETLGQVGLPLSGYFAAIQMDESRQEIARKVRWLNDFSRDLVTCRMVFQTEEDAKSLLLAYRINCEGAIKSAWRGRLTDLNDIKPTAACDGAQECYDDISAARVMVEAADLARGELALGSYHTDVVPEEAEIIRAVKPYTLTSNEKLLVLIHAVNHVVDNDIPGAVVECGVWKGGSMMAAAKTLLKRNVTRDLYLFDTFTGMTEPTARDVDVYGDAARSDYDAHKRTDGEVDWCRAPLDEVRNNLLGTGYPVERMHFVRGPVEQTVPAEAPEVIAVLRLDTDWYESTKHEMQHLFPRLSKHGILIIDDYGYWRGQREAVDEYFGENGVKLFLARVDHTGRVGMKA